MAESQEDVIGKMQVWAWNEIARVHPEIKPHFFSFDDPYMISEIVARDTYRFRAKPGDRVMDIGANVGVFTTLCAVNGAQVTAYEPHPEAYLILLDTIQRSGIQDRVIPKQMAVWTHSGQCAYHPGKTPAHSHPGQTWDSYNGAVVWPDNSGPANMACVSFEDAIGLEDWDCVKMDIEGAEFELLLTAPLEALLRIKYLTLELHNGWAEKPAYDALIELLGKFFKLEGTPDGDPRFAGEDRFISVYATRKAL